MARGTKFDQNKSKTEGILTWGQMRWRTSSQQLVAAASSSPSSETAKASLRCSSSGENWPNKFLVPSSYSSLQFLQRGGGRSHTKIFLGFLGLSFADRNSKKLGRYFVTPRRSRTQSVEEIRMNTLEWW
jgi:hypothetical protein